MALATVARGQVLLPACTPITFDGSTSGWTFQNLWHVSSACGAASGAHSTPNVLYFGLDAFCNFDDGEVFGLAETPPIVLPSQAQLRFNHRQQSEDGVDWDRSTVEFSVDAGPWTQLIGATELPRDNAWTPIARSLPAAGSIVRFRFVFDSGDGDANEGLGWMVDDIQVCGQVTAPVPAANPVGLALTMLLLSLAAFGVLRFRRR